MPISWDAGSLTVTIPPAGIVRISGVPLFEVTPWVLSTQPVGLALQYSAGLRDERVPPDVRLWPAVGSGGTTEYDRVSGKCKYSAGSDGRRQGRIHTVPRLKAGTKRAVD
jgi:hypothetical protein